MRALVVYYARAAVTERVAREIAMQLGADLDVVFDQIDEDGLLGWQRRAAPVSVGPLLREEQSHDVRAYDVVVVGSPVWDASFAGPIHAFLSDIGLRTKSLALFCTSGGGCGVRALAGMARVARRQPVATLAVTHAEHDQGSAPGMIHHFVSSVVSSMPKAPLRFTGTDTKFL